MPDIDLNLLRIFNILYEERSVTRTARRLALTQSAVSHALGRLRTMLDDPLYVRGPAGLQPTARASQIAPMVQRGLTDLQGALDQPLFDPATSQRQFNISAGSYFCALLIPELVTRTRIAAPRLRLRIWSPDADVPEALDEGRLDIALGGPEKRLSRIRAASLFEDELVWIASADSDMVRGSPDEAALLRAPRVMILSTNELSLAPAVQLRHGVHPQRSAAASAHPEPGGIVVYDAATALAIVSRSDAVALVPRRLVEAQADAAGVTIIRQAEGGERVTLSMRWHARADADPAVKWLRDMVIAAAPADSIAPAGSV